MTRIAAALDALADGLAARAGLAGVQITSAYLGSELYGSEFVMLDGDHKLDADWSSFGRLSRDERITIGGSVVVRAPGAGESVVRAARARAAAIFGEIEAYLTESASQNRLTVNGAPVVNVSRIRPTAYGDLLDTEGRVAILTFSVECDARLIGGAQ